MIYRKLQTVNFVPVQFRENGVIKSLSLSFSHDKLFISDHEIRFHLRFYPAFYDSSDRT